MAQVSLDQQQNDSNDIKMNDEEEEKLQFKELIAKNANQPKLGNDIRCKFPKIVLNLYDYKCKYHINPKDGGSVTFYPSPHLTANEYGTNVFKTEKFIHSNQLKHFLSKLGCKSIESVHDWNAEIIQKKDSFNGFVRAMEIAYFDHYPLRIKVSHIWILIMHALAAHIDVNAEKLRAKYVTHNGKRQLTVTRLGFVKGSRNNDWESIINEFGQQIDANTMNNIAKILENDFSNTSDLEKIAAKISLMAACKHYFNYVLRGGCGFHQITLDGNKNDWIKLKEKVELILKDFVDKKWAKQWCIPLFDILDRFIAVYDGEIDCLFWNSMVRRGEPTSGGMAPNQDPSNINSYYSGWINIFFPYLNQMKRATYTHINGRYSHNEGAVNDPNGANCSFQENNASKVPYSMDQFNASKYFNHQTLKYDDIEDGRVMDEGYALKGIFGPTSSLKVFPIGLANAPVLLKDLNSGNNYNLKFAAGFIGVEQNKKTLELCPKVGWFVAER